MQRDAPKKINLHTSRNEKLELSQKHEIEKPTSSVVGVQTSSEFLGFSVLGDEYSCKTLMAESDFEIPDFKGSSPLCRFV